MAAKNQRSNTNPSLMKVKELYTPLKINMERQNGGLVQIIFLFEPLIFRRVSFRWKSPRSRSPLWKKGMESFPHMYVYICISSWWFQPI